MEAEWKISESKPIPRWKVGLYIWRVNGVWRLRLYRPWRKKKFVEIQTTKFLLALYVMGVGADWWPDTVNQKGI